MIKVNKRLANKVSRSRCHSWLIDARLVLSETNELARRSKADRFVFGRKSGMRIKKELKKKKKKKIDRPIREGKRY